MASVYTITTRQSPLALWQSTFVQQHLQLRYPEYIFKIVPQTTQGDRISQPLHTFGGKDSFVKDLQEQLLQKKADIAVHSCKDLSVKNHHLLIIAAFCQREDPRDAFISTQFNSLHELPHGATLGTTSPRRMCQLLELRTDLNIHPLRGNVGTRLEKVSDGTFDGIVLAAAGLKRLNLEHRIKEFFDPHQFIPAIGQGIIAVECRKDDIHLQTMIRSINDADAEFAATAERAVNERLGGDCYTPVGAFAEIFDSIMIIQGMLGDSNGLVTRTKLEGEKKNAHELGITLANKLLSKAC